MSEKTLRSVGSLLLEVGVSLELDDNIALLVRNSNEIRTAANQAWSAIPTWSYFGRLPGPKIEAMVSKIAERSIKSPAKLITKETAIAANFVRLYSLLGKAEIDQGEDFLRLMTELGILNMNDNMVGFSTPVLAALFAAIPYVEPSALPRDFIAPGRSGERSLGSPWALSMLAKITLAGPEKRGSALKVVASRDLHLAALYVARSSDVPESSEAVLSDRLLDSIGQDSDLEHTNEAASSLISLGLKATPACRAAVGMYGTNFPRLLGAIRCLGHWTTVEDRALLEQISADQDLGWSHLRMATDELKSVKDQIAPASERFGAKAHKVWDGGGKQAVAAAVSYYTQRKDPSFLASSKFEQAGKILGKASTPPTPAFDRKDWLDQQEGLKRRQKELEANISLLKKQVPVFAPRIREIATLALARYGEDPEVGR